MLVNRNFHGLVWSQYLPVSDNDKRCIHKQCSWSESRIHLRGAGQFEGTGVNTGNSSHGTLEASSLYCHFQGRCALRKEEGWCSKHLKQYVNVVLVPRAPSVHQMTLKRQQEHEDHIDKDEEDENEEYHHLLGLWVHVTAQQCVQGGELLRAAPGSVSHVSCGAERRPINDFDSVLLL